VAEKAADAKGSLDKTSGFWYGELIITISGAFVMA
jgi:hypothetical protein